MPPVNNAKDALSKMSDKPLALAVMNNLSPRGAGAKRVGHVLDKPKLLELSTHTMHLYNAAKIAPAREELP